MIKTDCIIILKMFLRLLDRIVGKIVENRELVNKFWREQVIGEIHTTRYALES